MFRAIFSYFILVIFLSVCAWGGETNHYTVGVEGLKAGSVPPPGLYLSQYEVFYHADKFTDKDGEKMDMNFDLNVFASVSRLTWVTNFKVFGADFGVHAIVPFVDTNVEIGEDDDEVFNIGDIDICPVILAWHDTQNKRWDLACSYEFICPTGDSDNLADPGKDQWTHMISFGGTYFLGEDRSWNISALGRYEIHSEKDHSQVRAGNDFHIEWGVGKDINDKFGIGIAGYCNWQVTDDKGSDVTWKRGVHDRVYAIGPEITYVHKPWGCNISLRHHEEFGAVDRPEGHLTTLRIIKRF